MITSGNLIKYLIKVSFKLIAELKDRGLVEPYFIIDH